MKKTNNKIYDEIMKYQKYDVMTGGDEKLIMPITAHGNCVKYYNIIVIYFHSIAPGQDQIVRDILYSLPDIPHCP